jgi:hypothetical protein
MTAAENQRQLRNRRLSTGLCVACGKRPLDNGYIRCVDCRIRHNDSTRSRKSRNKANGLCACGNLATDGYKACCKCRETAIKNQEANTHDNLMFGRCKRCKVPVVNTTYCPQCAKIISNRGKKSKGKLRDLVISHYGGYKCVCCGETEKLFLTLDHINDDGAAHRRSINPSAPRQATSERLCSWLRDNNFPPGFQVLCFNCNIGKHRNGVCPHQSLMSEQLQELRELHSRLAISICLS